MGGWLRLALLGALIAPVAAPVVAHPMPNTEIALSLGAGGVAFDIAIPEPELRLALPQPWGRTADLLGEPQRSALAGYFEAHVAVLTADGAPVPLVVESLSRWDAQDENVGHYEELRVRLVTRPAPGFDPRHFSLRYDAVIHQVPNHFALVRRIDGDAPGVIGVIRYDFRRDTTPPLDVTLDVTLDAGGWRVWLAAVALGFRHVAGGLDHLLFLASLLIVSPLRAVERRWSPFQGWRYTARRFLGISLAFTAGHSLSLLLGVFLGVPFPIGAVETAIAGSVLLAALHGIRPLFAGHEWTIAAGFGLVHGLAFSEALAVGGLDAMMRVSVVLGFNLGVEGAQLAAMACALPLLYASRWRGFPVLRIATMAGVAALALVWIARRAT